MRCFTTERGRKVERKVQIDRGGRTGRRRGRWDGSRRKLALEMHDGERPHTDHKHLQGLALGTLAEFRSWIGRSHTLRDWKEFLGLERARVVGRRERSQQPNHRAKGATP
jgi:hypothetical protein